MTRSLNIILAHSSGHVAQIARLASEIWTEHYTPIIGAAQVAYMLEHFQSEAAIEAQIGEGTSYFLLLWQEDPVGYLAFYPKEGDLFLSKYYIQKSVRGKGLGREAMHFTASEAARLGLDRVVLTVNRNNRASIQAYQKMGFQNMGTMIQEIGNGYIMDDFLMALPLHE